MTAAIINNSKELIKLIRQAQKERGLTDEKLTFYSDLSKATVSHLFNGKSKEFTFQTILKIVRGLDCQMEIKLFPKKE